MSKLRALEDLAAAVRPASTVAIGGFQLSRVPVALLRAVAAHGADRLAAVCAPNALALDLLAAAHCLRAADCGFIGFQYEGGFVMPPSLKRALETGEVTLLQRDVYDTIVDLRAAVERNEPLADFALLHAQRADAAGNLGIDDPYLDRLLAAASRVVLATAETMVERVGDPAVRGERVGGVAIVPGGAAPAACHRHYPRAPKPLREYLDAPPAPLPHAAATPAPASIAKPSTRGGPTPAIAAARGGRTDEAAARRHADGFLANLARQVRDGEVIVTGLASAVPMLAIELARRTHAPRCRYINCIGALNPRIDRPFSTSVDPDLLLDCEDIIELPDLFDLARRGGVDTMFFGGGQIDAAGNINLSRIGCAEAPRVRFPGPAGSPSMRSFVRRVLISTPRQSPRNLVESVDVVTSAPSGRNRETLLITDLATWRLTEAGFVPESLCDGVTAQELASRTGFAFSFDGVPYATPPAAAGRTAAPPTPTERAALRDLDPAGLRFRLLGVTTPPPATNSSKTNSAEKALHAR